MNGIISQIQARNLLLDDAFISPAYKERETNFKEDPLVLSVSVQDLINKADGFYSLEDIRVVENITEEIRAKAETIRKYYAKKFFWSSLSSNRPISDFRTRLSFLLEHRVRKCSDKDCGIYYKLPLFYEEDVIYDEFKLKYNTTDLPQPKQAYLLNNQKEVLELEYLKNTVSRQQKRKIERFWFTDGTYLFSIVIEQDNPLIDMFKAMLVDKKVKFETYRNVDRVDQMYYYKLFRFNFAKE